MVVVVLMASGNDDSPSKKSPADSSQGTGRSKAPSLSIPTEIPSELPSELPSKLPSELPSSIPSDLESLIPSLGDVELP
ncbi:MULTISPECIES: hypothetical protein [unclassified Streptomyces]|uniref:hypothetical protein n=1 Tax=unclassified Streptomyces TaxID=2593676 RepID=UPI0022545E63|nr:MULTISPECIES: hypothetical protein [unclassified Streptomyces]MCX5053513.1 hypothetical protein [Streptomyces sp. NBC_00474]MCX5059220.1 hypothetical protein [Streptomyces sp. NBC_00452]MCX5244135.1 hypothetical protein [Streptomyces sp. NBC_00201]MCX5290132.1 hypothetical protein [Streptomyces sp. NBC_00183]